MRKVLPWLSLILVPALALAADVLYLPNLGGPATGTASGSKRTLDVNVVSGPGGANEDDAHVSGDLGSFSMGVRQDTATALAADGDYIPFIMDSSGRLHVNVGSSALPSGAATAANQTTTHGYIDGLETLIGTTNSTLSTIDGRVDGLEGYLDGVETSLTALEGYTDGVETAIASTNTKLDTVNTNLGTIDGRVDSLEGYLDGVETSLTAIEGYTDGLEGYLDGVEASLTSLEGYVDGLEGYVDGIEGKLDTLITQTAVSSSGSGAAGTVSTVITLTKPANAVGFVLMNMDTSTANLRWAIGRTATTTVGQQLQPGRSSDFVPVGADVSLVAESGTQSYDIQWIVR